MKMQQLLFVLVLYFTTCPVVTGACDVHNSTETKLQQCSEIQKCVNQALVSDERNTYVLEKVFRSSKPRPAVAVIINYYLRWTEITTQANSSGDGLLNEEIQRENISNSGFDYGSESAENLINQTESIENWDNNMTQTSIKNRYQKVQIGWSSSGVYTVVRPEILISLQLALLLRTVSFAIDNYGYPKTIDLYINLNQCNLPHTHMNYNELKETLEHLTTKLDYNSTRQLAYAWETSTTSFLHTELQLFIVIPILVFLAVLLAIGLPNLLVNELDHTWESIGLIVTLYNTGISEVNSNQIIIQAINIPLQLNIRLTVLLMTFGISIVIVIIAAVKMKSSISKCTCRIIIFAIFFFNISFLLIILSVAFLPLLIFTVIYPVEIISTLSFTTAIIAGISTTKRFLSWLIRKNSSYKSGNKSRKAKCYYYTYCTIAVIFCYVLVPFASYLLLILYLEMLSLLSESPTSQLFKLLLSFVPSVLTTIIGIMLTKKPQQEKKPNTSTKESDIELKTIDNLKRAEEGEPRS